ncbi:MAG: ABC transporter permease [Planctomycetota bacterium]|nr:ABC transporter permease [Planctomycetota bacterium]MDI6786819.1 ABC transporter permease [Planctomycetota bacterium]
MEVIYQGLKEAVNLILSGNKEIWQITLLSLLVSGSATFISMLIGIPLGAMIGLGRFPARRFVISLINTGMAFPPVVIGLFVVIFLWRSGPLGFLNILYTPLAMLIAQVIIATPIVMGISISGIQSLPEGLKLQTLSLGASYPQMLWILIKEARLVLYGAIMAGFGAVISEVGAVMMTGGNIKGQTRTLTTAIVTETRIGHLEIAIALAIILLLLTFVINLILTHLQQKATDYTD